MTQSIMQLVHTMQQLRGEHGCDWDRKQTLQSLKRYLLEEAYELIDTIDNLDKDNSEEAIHHHCEELGDLLLQVVFQSQIQSELGHFSFDDVSRGIVEKMHRRHPHVFGNERNDPAVEGNPYWHKIKEQEQKQKGLDYFASISKSQPALSRAAKLGEKAARLGFDWSDATDGFEKIREEVTELKEAMDKNDIAHAREEMGDLLHAIAQVARHLGIDPELALHQGNEKFIRRFDSMLKLVGGEDRLKTMSADEMLSWWMMVKFNDDKA